MQSIKPIQRTSLFIITIVTAILVPSVVWFLTHKWIDMVISFLVILMAIPYSTIGIIGIIIALPFWLSTNNSICAFIIFLVVLVLLTIYRTSVIVYAANGLIFAFFLSWGIAVINLREFNLTWVLANIDAKIVTISVAVLIIRFLLVKIGTRSLMNIGRPSIREMVEELRQDVTAGSLNWNPPYHKLMRAAVNLLIISSISFVISRNFSYALPSLKLFLIFSIIGAIVGLAVQERDFVSFR